MGGAGFISILVFFIWLFWIRKRRAQQDRELAEEWQIDEIAHQKRTVQFNAMHYDATSTRTRGSLATSMLSRASNFIQIAYIPGVTNRNGSGRNSIHAPVPPVPAAYRTGQTTVPPKSPLSHEGDTLFFGIDDLRGSTYSGASSNRDTRYTSNRDTRYTVHSITPSLARDSVASDVQWDSATTAPMPTSSLPKFAPRMVSVKSSQDSSNSSTPELGTVPNRSSVHVADQVREVPVLVPGQGVSPSLSVRGKATQIILGKKKGKGRFPVRGLSDASSTTTTTTTTTSTRHHAPLIPSPLGEKDSDSDSDEHARARDSLIQNMDFATPPAAQPTDSPFFDVTDLPSAAITAASSTRPNPYASMASTVGANINGTRYDRGTSRRGGSRGHIGALSAVIEEATKRASNETSASATKEADPFSDENEVER